MCPAGKVSGMSEPAQPSEDVDVDVRRLPKDYPPFLSVPCVDHVSDGVHAEAEYRTTEDGRTALLVCSALDPAATSYGIYSDWDEEGATRAITSNVVPAAVGTVVGAFTSGAIVSLSTFGADSLGDWGGAVADGVGEVGDTIGDPAEGAGDVFDSIF